MKKTIITLTLAVCAILSKAQGIDFEPSSLDLALKKAKLENKYILIDAYATWCSPCKLMNNSVFPIKSVGDFINTKFISIQIQTDQTNKDNELVKSRYLDAKYVVSNYGILAYPTILFLSPDGKLVHRAIGFMSEQTLITVCKEALNYDTQIYTQYGLFKKGKSDTAFLKRLAIQANRVGDTGIAEAVSARFFSSLKKEELYKEHNLIFAYQFTKRSNDRYFNVFLKQSKKVNSILRVGTAEGKAKDIIIAEEITPRSKKDSEADWRSIENTVKKKYGALGLEALYGERLAYSSDKKNWVDYAKYYKLYYNTALGRSRYSINVMSWIIFENVKEKCAIDAAVIAMKYSIDHFDRTDGAAYDTYANLLYKAGRREEAIVWQQKAVQLSPANKEIEENLEKMKRSEPTWVIQ